MHPLVGLPEWGDRVEVGRRTLGAQSVLRPRIWNPDGSEGGIRTHNPLVQSQEL